MKTLRRLIAARCGAPVKTAIRNLLDEVKAARLSRHSSRFLRELSGKRELNIHLGCGGDVKPGWVNIDIILDGGLPSLPRDSETFFFNYDIRLGLPLAAESCDMIYSSHFFEHLYYKQGVQLMRDCYKVLRRGGVFRVCLPNFKRAFEAYVNQDQEYFELIDISNVLPEVEKGTETIVDYINYVVYQSGEHKCVYDEEKIMRLLEDTGFGQVTTSSFKADIDVDSKVRRHFSFYVEAVK